MNPFLILVVLAALLVTFWPYLFLRWKHRHWLLIGNNLLAAALGAWAMIHFQLERHYSLYAEAEAIEASIRRLDSGADPRTFGTELEEMLRNPATAKLPLRDLLRTWREIALRESPRSMDETETDGGSE